VVAGQDVAKQQCYPNLSEGGHAGAYDSHSSPCGSPGEVLPQYA